MATLRGVAGSATSLCSPCSRHARCSMCKRLATKLHSAKLSYASRGAGLSAVLQNVTTLTEVLQDVTTALHLVRFALGKWASVRAARRTRKCLTEPHLVPPSTSRQVCVRSRCASMCTMAPTAPPRLPRSPARRIASAPATSDARSATIRLRCVHAACPWLRFAAC